MLISTIVLLFAGQITSVVSEIWEPPGLHREKVCKTKDCTATGEEYFRNLNPAVHPCDDFYTFACGMWYANHSPPPLSQYWSAADVMEKQLIKEIRDVLEQPLHTVLDDNLSTVKYFYDLCTKRPSFGRHDPKEIRLRIKSIGRAELRNLWDIHQGYFKLTGESPFFEYKIIPANPADHLPQLILLPLESPYGMFTLDDWTPEAESKYVKYLFRIMDSLDFPNIPCDLISQIQDVLRFRKNLLKLINQYKSDTSTKIMGVKDFSKWYETLEKPVVHAEHVEIPWKTLFNMILHRVSKPLLSKGILRVKKIRYFEDLHTLLGRTNVRILVNHMEFYFIERHLQYTEEINLLEEVIRNASGKVKETVPLWESCIRNSNLWTEMGKTIDMINHLDRKKEPIMDILAKLKDTMIKQVSMSDWMNKSVQQEAVRRINTIKPLIGTSSWSKYIETSAPNAEPLLQNPLMINANLGLVNYSLYVSSSLAHSPLIFNPNLPGVYNYGAIGYVLGHELHHVLFNCGVYVNKNMKVRTWLPPENRAACKKRLECFIEAYKKTTARDLQQRYRIKAEINTQRTVMEDFADVMGLETAYLAYKRDKNAPNLCETLPRFEKYSCDQMFFISFANTFCSKMTPTFVRGEIKHSAHSIDSVRVNGAIENNEYFRTAFTCPPARPMNPPEKCNLLRPL